MQHLSLTRRQLLEAAAAATILGPGFSAFAGDRQQREASFQLGTREAFEQYGVVRIPGAVPGDLAVEMGNLLARLIAEHHGFRRDDPSSWSPAARGMVTVQGAIHLMGAKSIAGRLRASEPFKRLEAATREAVDQLFGDQVWRDQWKWVRPTVNYPVRGNTETAWTVPRSIWYGGGVVEPDPLPWVMSCTVLLEPSVPGGGGPLTIPGSHRLIRHYAQHIGAATEEMKQGLHRMNPSIDPNQVTFVKSRKVKRLLASRVPWFDQLLGHWGTEHERIARFMQEGCVHEGVPVKVAEMTGQPGDLFLGNLVGLTALSANISEQPFVAMTMNCMRA